MTQRFIRIKDVVDLTTLSKSEIYRKVGEGSFPRPLRLSHKRSVWLESDVGAWMSEQIENCTMKAEL